MLLALAGAAKLFEELSTEYAKATAGHRAKLYDFAARCFKVGLGFQKRLDLYAEFKQRPFWADARQKPKDDKIMRAVLVFAAKARSRHLQSSLSKTAKVLEHLAEHKVRASEVAKRLKDGGGIEKMYADLSPNLKGSTRTPDDLEMLSADAAGGNDPVGEEVQSWPEVEEEDDAVRAGDADGPAPGTMAMATQAPTIVDSRRPRNPSISVRFDAERDLIIDLSETNLSPSDVWDMERIQITARVGQPDQEGWRIVTATKLVGLPKTKN